MAYYKVSVAEILKDKPRKTILYDAMRDINVSLYVVEKQNGETNIFCDGMEKFKGCSFVYSDTGADSIFRKGMQLLKPSKEMQDWEKFSWKRGDVLISDCGFVCIFKDWVSVEDELPPYYEAVLVCHKDFPCNVRIANRVAGERNSFIDSNGFTHDEFDLPVSHWEPIEKLEE